jgi:hypothetical protein
MKAIIFIGLLFALAGCDKGGTKALEERLAKAEEKIAILDAQGKPSAFEERLTKVEGKIVTLESQGKPNWILTRRVMTKGLLYAPMSPPPVSAFSSKELCLKAAITMVDADAVQKSVEPPEFESPTKTFNFTCLPSAMQSNIK